MLWLDLSPFCIDSTIIAWFDSDRRRFIFVTGLKNKKQTECFNKPNKVCERRRLWSDPFDKFHFRKFPNYGNGKCYFSFRWMVSEEGSGKESLGKIRVTGVPSTRNACAFHSTLSPASLLILTLTIVPALPPKSPCLCSSLCHVLDKILEPLPIPFKESLVTHMRMLSPSHLDASHRRECVLGLVDTTGTSLFSHNTGVQSQLYRRNC